jgi:hypothetical protein
MLLRDSPFKGAATADAVLARARGALGDDPGGHRASSCRSSSGTGRSGAWRRGSSAAPGARVRGRRRARTTRAGPPGYVAGGARAPPPARRVAHGRRMLPALVALFVLSGAAGLMYESIWTRYLGLFVGHGAYAQLLVLVIFLGGMSLGAHTRGAAVGAAARAAALVRRRSSSWWGDRARVPPAVRGGDRRRVRRALPRPARPGDRCSW